MLMTTTINDEETLRSIVNDLGANLIVEAGAGTGKTYALVSRVVALVKSGVRMQNIVAITFTDAAAAELSERVRSRMEQLLEDGLGDSNEDLLAKDMTDQERGRIRQAVAELDQAAVQTIHSFAAQLLRDRPLSANLPPGWVPLDAVDSTERFAERWDQWLERTLSQAPDANPELTESLRYLVGVKAGLGTWREVAKAFADNYERLASEGSIPEIDLGALAESTLDKLEELSAQCIDHSDRLFEQISSAIETVRSVLDVADRLSEAVRALEQGAKVDFDRNVGSSKNWNVPPKEIRDRFREEIGKPFQVSVRCAPALTVLQNLRQTFALRYTAQRKAEGVASFEDILVWARDLLHDDATARRRFQDLYTHILIDEFQDTDPLTGGDRFLSCRGARREYRWSAMAHRPTHSGQAVHRGGLQTVHLPVPPGRHWSHPPGKGERATQSVNAYRKPPFPETGAGLDKRLIQPDYDSGAGFAGRVYPFATQPWSAAP